MKKSKPTLNAFGKQVKKLVVDDLSRRGLLEDVDDPLVDAYCFEMMQYYEAVAHLQAEGPMVETGAGGVKPSPWIAQRDVSLRAARSLAGMLGIGAAARKAVGAQGLKAAKSAAIGLMKLAK